MAPQLLPGPRRWAGQRDAEGHRTYRIKFRVQCDPRDGPSNAMQTPGLPLPGSLWIIDADVDFFAWFRPDATITPVEQEGDPNRFFDVEMTASTRPPPLNQQRCQDTPIEDPLLEPPKVSGSFVKYTEVATHDRFGQRILSSSHQALPGSNLEFDANRPTVRIEQNVATSLQAYVFPAQFMDAVNAFPLWGLPARCVKLSSGSWERKFFGQCAVYYTRNLEFDINVKLDPDSGLPVSGWDRTLRDEGTKVLAGQWVFDEGEDPPNRWVVNGDSEADPLSPADPTNFYAAKDPQGENAAFPLDGFGRPWSPRVTPGTSTRLGSGDPDTQPGSQDVQKYPGVDFTLLGIPLDF